MPAMRRFLINQIRATSLFRSVGYFEEVMRVGLIDGDFVELTDDQCREIGKKFRADSKWPMWAKIISKQKTKNDVGVGDTVSRLIVGGESFKLWFKNRFGKSCGCAERQDALNKKYPYDVTN
jgi:hypothetical protein